ALEQSRDFIAGELHAAGATVVLESFTASTPLGAIPMTNLVAKIPGSSSVVVIIAGHYDTKRSTFPFMARCPRDHPVLRARRRFLIIVMIVALHILSNRRSRDGTPRGRGHHSQGPSALDCVWLGRLARFTRCSLYARCRPCDKS